MSFSSGKNLQNNVSTTEAQTLSNKTMDSTTVIQSGADIQTPAIIDPNRSDVKKDTLSNLQTYAASASNGQLCYATDSKKMFQVLDGALAEVGGGAGGINYITNPDAEVNADGWNDYANTTPGELPDDFGGTVSGSWSTIAASPSGVLRGSKSFLFGGINSGSGDLQGHGVYSSFTVDSADLAKKMTISFDYKIDDANLTNAVDGMLRVYIYDEDKSELIRVNGEDLQLNANSGTHYAQFQTDSVSTNYRLVIHNALAITIAEDFTVRMDNVQVGPTAIAKGTIVTDWEDFDMVIGATVTPPTKGTATEKAKWRRVGSNMEITYTYYQTGGGVAGTGAYLFELPSGYSIDTSLLVGGSGTALNGVGEAQAWQASQTNLTGGVRVYDSTQLVLDVNNQTLAGSIGSTVASIANTVVRYSFTASVPIQGWSSNAKMSEDLGGREIYFIGKGNAGESVTNGGVDIPFISIEDTTASWDGSSFTAPETGNYSIEGSFRLTASLFAGARAYVNGSELQYIGGLEAASPNRPFSAILKLNKGDVFSLRTDVSGTLLNTPTLHNIHIQKLASPQTILETETVAARYTSNSGQPINSTQSIFIYEDIVSDTHNAYNTSTGEYTTPVSGYYNIEGSIESVPALFSTTDYFYTEILVNNFSIKRSLRYGNGATVAQSSLISTLVYLEKGDVIDIRARAAVATTSETVSQFNNFSIARIK